MVTLVSIFFLHLTPGQKFKISQKKIRQIHYNKLKMFKSQQGLYHKNWDFHMWAL